MDRGDGKKGQARGTLKIKSAGSDGIKINVESGDKGESEDCSLLLISEAG